MEFARLQDASARRRRRRRIWGRVAVTLFAAAMACPAALAVDKSASLRSWREAPGFVSANEAIAAWLAQQHRGQALAARWNRAVAATPRPSRLAEPLRTLAAQADERFVSLLNAPVDTPPVWLTSLGDAEPSVRLAVADALAAADRYDACLAWTEGLEQDQVFSPALLSYLRAVAWRMTVDDDRAAEAIERLPADDEALGPARKWVLDALQNELESKPQPMPIVARKMRDVQRRLALAEPGAETQERQQAILDELDKLIEKLEEQRKQQQQMAAAAPGGGAEPGDPADESRPSELKGPGEVDRKRLVAGDAWGSLPPAERERLTQAITRDFPPHYRGLIEDYFRTLAAEADAAEPDDPPAADR
ncbi:hypothetical protein Pla108_31780 [Botrimarina colliarenosi]|uniref:Secreted protein n=1 Tax=Botrimarina colliarenosi TaxID=2528001 RepID=A0A5C6A9H8_9BACT|nr:hypothetical protein [Botrimarina colliarenosi]TWT96096.1 hypothetical protein Pla108_31780 [Botrimarina colliarenosi]